MLVGRPTLSVGSSLSHPFKGGFFIASIKWNPDRASLDTKCESERSQVKSTQFVGHGLTAGIVEDLRTVGSV